MKHLLENWKKYLHESEQSSPEANQDPGMPSPEEEKFFPWLEHIKNKKPSLREFLFIAQQLSSILVELHQRQIIHKDISIHCILD